MSLGFEGWRGCVKMDEALKWRSLNKAKVANREFNYTQGNNKYLSISNTTLL
jgi:hypothetical protein